MPATKKPAKKRVKKRKTAKLSPEERKKKRIARKHQTDIRTTFTRCGFQHIATRNKDIEIAGRRFEFDGLYVFENILIIAEDTAAENPKTISEHLRKKADGFNHVNINIEHFIESLKKHFPQFRQYIKTTRPYDWNEYHIRYLYCSLYSVTNEYKNRYNKYCMFLDNSCLMYLLSLSKSIAKSARYELMKFLDIQLSDIKAETTNPSSSEYDGLLLPETPSGFDTGFKILTFLVDPNILLERGYVLRADSWRDAESLYQRLLIKNKLDEMRKFLSTEGRVFVNNIIATLPSGTTITDKENNIITEQRSDKIESVKITIPREFNTIGIIDGQHRIFAYHERDDKLDKKISELRRKQHLLVTAMQYPDKMSDSKKQKFEAKLFLEINDKQKRVKGDLKQSIEMIVNPTSSIAISKAVIAGLSNSGPLDSRLEVHFYDSGKIKTTSIVSYGMKHIVGIDAENSLYNTWRNRDKKKIRKNKIVLQNYIQYCVTELNMLISGFKSSIPADMWTADKKISRVLTTITINGLIYCMRKLIENNKTGDYEYYSKAFKKGMKISFKPEEFKYKSSHWKELGEELYDKCFARNRK